MSLLLPLARFALARLAGRRHPASVAFMLTHRCNFRCAYCSIASDEHAEMSTAEIRATLDDMARAGVLRVGFSGGEPLLRADLVDVLEHAHRLGLATSLNTNGWDAGGRMADLAPHLDLLVVSLDGPAATHDAARRTGSHARAVAAIGAARRLGLPVATQTVVSRANLDQIDAVLDLADALDFWAFFQPEQRECYDRLAGWSPDADRHVRRDLARHLERARHAGRRVGNSRAYVALVADDERLPGCRGCAAGRWTATVLPDGTLVPCHLTARDQPYPNVRTLGFARAFRELPPPLPTGACTIGPNLETTLALSFDPLAVATALHRVAGRAPGGRR